MRRRIVWLGCIILLLLSAAGTASAAVRLDVEQGFEGYVVPGRCTPLRVNIEGLNGSAAIEIDERTKGERRTRVSYPLFATGEQTLLELPIYARETGSRINLRLVAKEQVLSELMINTSQRIFPGHLILTSGVLPSIREAIQGVLGAQEPVWTVGVEPNDLPKTVPGYDSVSAIVLRDPGPSLNPAQIRALRVWLSGGGRLVVIEPLTRGNSILSEIAPGFSKEKNNDWLLGMGQIMVLDQSMVASMDKVEFWKELLALQPFVKSKRLSVIQAFTQETKTQKPLRFSWKAALFLITWACTVLLVRRFSKNEAFWMICTSIIFTILAFPMGNELAKDWHRGAEVRTRVVALPGGEGLFFENQIHPLRRGIWKGMMGYRPSPWKIHIHQTDFGDGIVHEGRGGEIFWRHQGGTPQQLNLPGEHGMRRIGWIPLRAETTDKKIQRFIAEADFTAIWEDGKWQVLRRASDGTGKWVSVAALPEELREELEWTHTLTRINPENRWVFGYGHIPGLQLSVQGNQASKGFWALPVMEGDLP